MSDPNPAVASVLASAQAAARGWPRKDGGVGRLLGRVLPGKNLRDDWDLWRRACEGHEASASELVRQLTPQAYGLAMQVLRQPEDAQDMVQESFLRLWGSRPSDAHGATLATYFNTIVINRCKTLLGQRRELATENESLTEMADARQAEDTPTDALLHDIAPARLAAALSALPPRQRMALAMWAYADADVAGIARSLSIDTNAAHQLLHRAKLSLRLALTGDSP